MYLSLYISTFLLKWAGAFASCRYPLTENWRACKVSSDGQCFPAVVPGTVLSTLLHNKIWNLTDPFFEQDLMKIPDIANVGPDFYTYSFSLQFDIDNFRCDEVDGSNKRVLLNFKGINYRANISVNGIVLSQSSDQSGMFQSRNLDVTSHLNPDGSINELFVVVFPPDQVGVPNGAQGGDHEIARNGAIHQFAAGWDWIQASPDRNTGLSFFLLIYLVRPNMKTCKIFCIHLIIVYILTYLFQGIWDKVELVLTGSVSLSYPYVRVAYLSLQDLTASLDMRVIVSCSEGVATSGLLKARIYSPAGVLVLDNITSAFSVSTDDTEVAQEVTFPLATIQNVELWYPHTHGPQRLYTVEMEAEVSKDQAEGKANSGDISDSITVEVGIRSVEPYLHDVTKSQAFKINGEDVFLVGGNWIATDQFLRFSRGDRISRERYWNEVKFHRDMGFNLIRVWGGGLAETSEFYEACDRLGVFVFQEFWMTGDNNGRWGGNYTWPDDHDSYLSNAKDVIVSRRNHASLLLWLVILLF